MVWWPSCKTLGFWVGGSGYRVKGRRQYAVSGILFGALGLSGKVKLQKPPPNPAFPSANLPENQNSETL